MATEDDNFDIDIYGDGTEQGDFKTEDPDLNLDTDSTVQQQDPTPKDTPAESKPPPTNNAPASTNGDHTMTTDSTPAPEAPAPHGVKRKEYDDRQSDPDATTALLISDLFWWTTDDVIRGWIAEASSEDDLKDVTFSEHKVNGKSKGQAFVEFTTPQAATATKHTIEIKEETGSTGRKYAVTYTNPNANPFKTLPKDAPMRKDNNRGGMAGGFNSGGGGQNMNFNNNMGGGYRGRGGYNRGMGGNFNNNNRGNFNNMGFQGGGGPGNMMGGGFQGAPMGMQNYGFNRGGMMGGGMRGGPGGMRGGRGNMMGMPGMNPMNNMGMNPMNPMMGNMGAMGGNMPNMGQGFQGPNPAFNQGFFNNNNQGGGDASWNPHGAKRSRQE